MATETYTKTKDKNLGPVNIIPSDLIKCTHCNMYVSYKQLQAHTQMHIPINLRENHHNNQQIKKKVDLKNLLADDNFDEIQVRSILPEQMPCKELIRKQALTLPKGTDKYKFNDNKAHEDWKSNIDEKRCSFKKPQQLLQSVQLIPLQFVAETGNENLSFKKQIQVLKQQKQLKLKSLNYYTNQKPNVDGAYKNQVVIPAKYVEQKLDNDNEHDQNIQSYSIEPVQKIKKSNSPIRVQLNSAVKLVKHKQRISTASTGHGFHLQTESHWNHNESTSREAQIGNGVDCVNEFQCPECKGFYCKTCKSDIPPMFRPPIRKIEGNEMLSKDWRQFRESGISFNKSGGQTSRVTRCTNCQ